MMNSKWQFWKQKKSDSTLSDEYIKLINNIFLYIKLYIWLKNCVQTLAESLF